MIPLNPFLICYLLFFAAITFGQFIIEVLNVRHMALYGNQIPSSLKGIISPEELKKINRYGVQKVRFSQLHTALLRALFLLIVLSGLLPRLEMSLTGIHFVVAGLIFFGVPGLIMAAAEIPFDYYHTFVVEERFGFNTGTFRIWLSDLAKSWLLGALIGGTLISSILLMIRYAGNMWWMWAWIFFLGFQLLMTLIYPALIAPIFNAFIPVKDEELLEDIEAMAQKEGLGLQGIYQMDGTKRSLHTNAYLSGLGKQKRMVFFDSLIASHTKDEILAVLAHEMGHLKKNHMKKQLALQALISFGVLFAASKMLTWQAMFQAFGFSGMPAYAGLFVAGILWEPLGFFSSPLLLALSRKFERDADMYGIEIIGDPEPLSRALKKMAGENLSNLFPHPLHVLFNESHPPFLKRIADVESAGLRGGGKSQ